ncbi:YWTD domain-containing protein [Cadophora sp. DSE1049]|nr:YWTD domain-containing protein [Cadophora sp. DSE1049]
MAFQVDMIKHRPVAVLGGGILGRRIASGSRWLELSIRDPSPEQRNAALHYVENNVASYAQAIGVMTPGKAQAFESLEEAVKDAWTVIEAVPENLSLKIGVELMTDGQTDEDTFPFCAERLRAVGMHPIIAQKESTGFVFNRVWAAIKRECLTVLAEGKNCISQGKLSAKSGKGGLYPPGATTKVKGDDKTHHDNLSAPSLYVLDIGLNTLEDTIHSGKIPVGSPDGRKPRTRVSGQALPDGLAVSLKTGRIYWTNMGIPTANDGMVQSCKLDGSDNQTVIPKGVVHTPKQLTIDQRNDKLYFCDREGLRVMRANLDGSQHETIIQNGLSKGGKGRIFRANIETPKGEDASTRKDIELLLSRLPEPIDLEIDEDSQTLFWTDRGDPPTGNSLNSINTSAIKGLKEGDQNPKYNILTRQLHEAIGLKLDQVNKHIYLTDLGGSMYMVDFDGKNKKVIYDEEAAYSGIGLAHV